MAILRPEAIDDAPARGPQRSGGRREAAFLPREECAEPGSPGDLSPGVVNRGPRATCRVGWSRRGRKLTDAVAAQAIEAQPSSGQIKPREVAWDALPDSPGDAVVTGSARRKGTPRLGRQHPLNAGLSIQPTWQRLRLSASVSSLPVGAAWKRTSRAGLHHARRSAPAAIGLKPGLVVGTRVSTAVLAGRGRH